MTDVALADIFKSQGVLHQQLGASYHFRSGQLEMAQAVAQAIHDGGHAIIEAGTGIGKTFAYLIPLMQQGRQCWISTANKALQTQLFEKDLPFLKAALSWPGTFALLKGRQNYICNLRLSDLVLRPTASTDLSELGAVNAGLLLHPNGDLDYLNVPWQLRQDLTVNHEDCLDEDCRFYRECYYQRAKLAADAAPATPPPPALLARLMLGQNLRELVVVDEAHELAGYVASAQGGKITLNRLVRLLRGSAVQRFATEASQKAEKSANDLFRRLSFEATQSDQFKVMLTKPALLEQGQTTAQQLKAVAGELERNAARVATDNEARPGFQMAQRRMNNLLSDMESAFSKTQDRYVRYLELSGDDGEGNSQADVNLQPVEVGEFLHDAFFARVSSVILTSATLAVDGSFAFFRREVGLPQDVLVAEHCIESPYDYRRQSLLYIPRNLEPFAPGRTDEDRARQAEFLIRLQAEIRTLIDASEGRALVLFTSKARMWDCYEAIRKQVPYECYIQGQMPAAQLIQRFKDETSSVLFATRSYWAGLDVAGESLSLVIVERPPYPSPADPVYQKKKELLTQTQPDLDSWNDLSIPEAILDLRQGIGRLIRNETDRGVAAILDSRLINKSYGARVLASLPFYGYVTDQGKVEAFLKQPPAPPPPAQMSMPAAQPARPAQDPSKKQAPAPARSAPAQPAVPRPAAAQPPGAPAGASGLPTLSGYRLVRRLGKGGFGVVYEAEHVALKRPVAIKELLTERLGDERALQRFLQEARIAAGFDHPTIVKVYDLVPANGRYYLVMEYLAGGTLKDRMRAQPLPAADVICIGADMCRALALVHARGIIHRDIKPENILFASETSPA
ncbi:MAG: helicase C-terminal domain-containing protein, partial [Bacteroidota bacterium]